MRSGRALVGLVRQPRVLLPLVLGVTLLSPVAPSQPAPPPGSHPTAEQDPPASAAGAAVTSLVRSPPAEVVPAPPAVARVEPDLLVRIRGALPAGAADRVAATAGVTAAEPVGTHLVTVRTVTGPAPLRLLVADATTLRRLAPAATHGRGGLWHRLAAGEIVLRPGTAADLLLEPGERLELLGPEDRPARPRVAALADLGDLPVDALVGWEVGRRLAAKPDSVVVAAAEGAGDVGARLRQALAGHDPTVATLGPSPPRRPARIPTVAGLDVEAFTYTDTGAGVVAVDPDWVERRIVRAEVPVLGAVRCHRALVPALRGALAELEAAGLAHLLDPADYGGCYVPRHIGWSEARRLSVHTWGLAIDLNVRTNGYGDPPQLDPRVVETFRRWGFSWGGDWRVPDGMHFELRRAPG